MFQVLNGHCLIETRARIVKCLSLHFAATCKEAKGTTTSKPEVQESPDKAKKKDGASGKRKISTDKRQGVEPGSEDEEEDEDDNEARDPGPEADSPGDSPTSPARAQTITFSMWARNQNQLFIVADIVCTAVFDIVYALVNR